MGQRRVTLRLIVCAFAALHLGAGVLMAQSGSIFGRVTDANSGDPIAGANALVVSADSQFFGAATDIRGDYLVNSLPVGDFSLRITYLGYEEWVTAGIHLEEGQPVRIDIALKPTLIYENEIVVSAVSRRTEKAVDAPAGVSVVEAREIAARPVLSASEHVMGQPAVDVATTGIAQSRVAVRGFNNVIDNADGLLLLTDYRNAAFPAVRLNMFQLIPSINEDIERIEIVRGPGSALYGPNAANGVMNIVTKSPLTSQGTDVMFGLGERDVLTGSMRYASMIGDRLGVKLSGRYFQGNDWEYDDPAEPDSVVKGRYTPDGRVDYNGLVPNDRDYKVENGSVEGRVDYQANDDLVMTLSGGWARITSINQTVVGAAYYKDAALVHLRGQVVYKDLFFQTYWNKGNLEDGFLLRNGNQIIERSSVISAQLQHKAELAGGRQLFTYGMDGSYTNPNSGYTLNGVNEDDDAVTELGAYLQSETRIARPLRVVAAVRADKHSQLSDVIFSPRLALLVAPRPDHTLRITYNRAYSTPAIPALFLDLPIAPSLGPLPYPIRGLGLPETGFHFRRDDSGGVDGLYMQSPFNPAGPQPSIAADAVSMWPAVVSMLGVQGIDISGIPAPTSDDVGTALALLNTGTSAFDPVDPENVVDVRPPQPTITSGLELGYKGALGSKVFVFADGYYTSISDRMSSLNTLSPNVFLEPTSLLAYLGQFVPAAQAEELAAAIAAIPLGTVTPDEAAAQAPGDIILSYRNYDETLTLWGADLGATVVANDQWRIRGDYSYVSKDLWPANGTQLEDIALNAPRHKAALSVQYLDAPRRFDAAARVRYTQGFPVRAGVYVGNVASYTVVDLTVGWGIPGVPQSKLAVSIQNLLNNKHQEFVGAPEIGRMTIVQMQTSF